MSGPGETLSNRPKIISEGVIADWVRVSTMAVRRAHARHILVPSKGQATQLLERIEKARKPLKEFQKMARKHSTCPSSSKGGDLGWFQERQMVREFSEAVWGQDLNAVGRFVKTGFGYHIIWVHERDED